MNLKRFVLLFFCLLFISGYKEETCSRGFLYEKLINFETVVNKNHPPNLDDYRQFFGDSELEEELLSNYCNRPKCQEIFASQESALLEMYRSPLGPFKKIKGQNIVFYFSSPILIKGSKYKIDSIIINKANSSVIHASFYLDTNWSLSIDTGIINEITIENMPISKQFETYINALKLGK